MARLLLTLLALLILPACTIRTAPAMSPIDHLPALRGGYFPLQSQEVGRNYHIYVRLPEGYETGGTRRYPVVYLLDGDSLFPILAAQHLFLTYDDRLPEAIVVGIAYGSFDPAVNRRSIDFTPPGEGVEPSQAGAPAFMRFLRTELLPRIERDYRADPARRILFGQSRGGGFVLYSAFADPDLFWGRIASNPALRPARNVFFGPAPAAEPGDRRIVVASGERDRPLLREDALAWLRHWEGRPGLPWTIRGLTIPGGTHAANSPDAHRRAMRWLFDLPDP